MYICLMKAIIQRHLPLTVNYTVIDKKYIPLESGCGMCCDNCGKLIANIATIKSDEGNIYSIGFDCLETILINNSLLSTNDILDYERVKKMIPKIIRFSKTVKEQMTNSSANITGLLFDSPMKGSDYYPFYWLCGDQTTSRNNDYVKLKEMDFDFLLKTMANIFPKLRILTTK